MSYSWCLRSFPATCISCDALIELQLQSAKILDGSAPRQRRKKSKLTINTIYYLTLKERKKCFRGMWPAYFGNTPSVLQHLWRVCGTFWSSISRFSHLRQNNYKINLNVFWNTLHRVTWFFKHFTQLSDFHAGLVALSWQNIYSARLCSTR